MALEGWECSELSGPATWPGLPTRRGVRPLSSANFRLHEHQGGGAVGQGRGVAGGDGAVRDERRAQRRPAISTVVSGRMPSSAVDGDRVALALLDAIGAISPSKTPSFAAAGGALVRRGRDLVLGGPVDAEGQVLALRRQPHGLPVEGVGQPVVGGDVEGLDRAVGPALPGAGQHVRCAGHGLLAAGDHHRGVAAADHPGGVDHGGEAREADLVDGHRGDVPADAGADGALARRVLARSGLQDLAHDHAVHLVGLDAAGGQGRADGVGAELDGGEAGQLPVQAPLGGAGCGEDDNIVVVCRIAHGVFFRSTSTYVYVIVSPVTYPFGPGLGPVRAASRPLTRSPRALPGAACEWLRQESGKIPPNFVLAIPPEVG